jgi:NAD(P)H-hydrate epimerase
MHEFARIPTTKQLRELEAAWIKECGANWGVVLMEAAGLGAAGIAASLLAGQDGCVAVICGSGNNGGDGLVIARQLHLRGFDVHVCMVRSDKAPDAGSANGVNKHIVKDLLGLPIHYFDEDSLDSVQAACDTAALIVDALLGTGLDRQLSGAYAEAVGIINDSEAPVLAVDVPSGINSDTGQVMGVAIEADVTVTFGYLKPGLLHYPGAQHAAAINLIDIGLPSLQSLPSPLAPIADRLAVPSVWLATRSQVLEWLPARPADGHKGTFGRVLAIAGSATMTGSCMLACRSVLRSGAGYAVLATARSVVEHLPPEEIVYHPLNDTAAGAIAETAVDQLTDQLKQADAVLIGPGLGGSDGTVKLVEKLLGLIDKPCLIDADGLNAIARSKTFKTQRPDQVILTPHPKELERLTGESVATIQSDRVGAAERARQKFGCTIVLKGARTVVAAANGTVHLIPTGNSGMATPGAGDVLSGVIAAFLAEGMPPSEAAIAGAYVHGAAGDEAADRLGQDGMVAHDIMESVPTILSRLRHGTYEPHQIELEIGL